ncbi:MAG: O-antigen ligase family protein [bacterium]|nr:O-antigen ligase family protein [bacterium]
MIISSLIGFFKSFGEKFVHTGIYSLIMSVYGFFSRAWSQSIIMTKLKADSRDGMVEKSIIWHICRIPFAILEAIGRGIGKPFLKAVKKSVICAWGYSYIQNFMAVNTRFMGILLLCASISAMLIKLIISGFLIKWLLIAAAFGAVLMIFNYNLMGFLNPSWIVKLIKCFAGFKELDFEFYDENETGGRTRLILAALAGVVSGAVMITVSPLLGAAVPFALFGAALVMWKPVIGVFAAVFIAPIVPTMVLAACCIWTGLSLVFASWMDKKFKWKLDGVGMGIILLIAVLGISSLLSFAMIGSIKVWLMYLVLAGFYFVIVNTINTKEQLYSLLRLFVISGALVALYGVCQYIFGWTTTNAWIDETMFEDETMRVYSTLGNPNVLGEFMLLVLPVSVVFMLKDSWKHSSKYIYALMFVLLFLCLILTQSRGCWIGFMISAVIFVTFYEGRWWSFIPIVVLILPLVVPDTIVERLMSVGDMDDSSTSYRVYIWLATLNMLKVYWVGGIGMGEAAFNEVYPFYSYNAIIAPHSHNTFLQLTVEAGVGALILFIALQAVFARKMQSVYKLEDKKSMNSTAALAIGAGVIGFLVQSMFDYTFYNYRVMCIFFMVMAMGTALKQIAENGAGTTGVLNRNTSAAKRRRRS